MPEGKHPGARSEQLLQLIDQQLAAIVYWGYAQMSALLLA
jgi:hypothetical protein